MYTGFSPFVISVTTRAGWVLKSLVRNGRVTVVISIVQVMVETVLVAMLSASLLASQLMLLLVTGVSVVVAVGDWRLSCCCNW